MGLAAAPYRLEIWLDYAESDLCPCCFPHAKGHFIIINLDIFQYVFWHKNVLSFLLYEVHVLTHLQPADKPTYTQPSLIIPFVYSS